MEDGKKLDEDMRRKEAEREKQRTVHNMDIRELHHSLLLLLYLLRIQSSNVS